MFDEQPDGDPHGECAAEIHRLRDALESIRQYGADTLSGRVDGPDDRAWQRAAVLEMTKRARLALEAAAGSAALPPPPPTAMIEADAGVPASDEALERHATALGRAGPLGRAISVLQDVLTDIEDWEDKALAEAVTDARKGLLMMLEVEKLKRAANPVPRVIASGVPVMGNRCGCNHWQTNPCPARNCPWQGKRPVDAAVPHRESDSIAVETLRQHWLRAIECDHATGRDKPHCACSRVDLGWHPSVGGAVEAWLTHVSGAPAESVPNAVLGRDGVLRVEAPAAGVPESDSIPRADGVKATAPGYALVPIEPTQDMLYAMAECDGHQRGDRDHPMLTRWEDYWRVAVAAAPVGVTLRVPADNPEHPCSLCGVRGAHRCEVVNWIPVSERMPEPETECLVWSHPSWSKQPLAQVDRWGEQHEAPVGWSSAMIPIGLGWDSSAFEDVSHWMPITPPAAPLPAAAPKSGETPDQPEKRPGEISGCNTGNRCPWGEESAPDWRSVCRACGRRAQGSGQ